MAQVERTVNKFEKTRTFITGDSYEANVFGGHLKYQTNGIYLTSDNGSLIRLNRNGLFMRDADILLKNGSLNISGGQVAIYSAPNGLTSNTYMLMSNDGLSAFKNGTTSFYIDAKTGNVALSGGIFAGFGSIGTWEIYPNGLSSNYNGYTIFLSPEYGINYNNKFFVNSEGAMTATRGLIGSWDIYDNGLSASFSPYAIPLSALTGALSSMTAAFSYNIRLSPEDGFTYNDIFRVTQYGELFAQYAFIKGSICADSGYLNNLEVRGTLSSGKYWYDSNHYLNLAGDTLTAFNMNDKFVVLTTGDVYLSNLYATGSITSYDALLGGWIVDQTSIYQNNLLDSGDRYAVYLSTSSQPASVQYPSGRGTGLQVFNNGLSSDYYFDLSVGMNLIQTDDSCGLIPYSNGKFGNQTLVRDPNRVGLQVTVGSGTVSAHTLFEISSISGNKNYLNWPDLKASIAGWKFDQFGFYSCDNTFRISSSAGYPSILMGSTSAGFMKFGSSAGQTYMIMGTTAQQLNFFGSQVLLNAQSITSNTFYNSSYAYFGGAITGHRSFVADKSLTAPISMLEHVTKAYVDREIDDALTASLSGFSGISGNGTPDYIVKFLGASSVTDSIMSEDSLNNSINVNGNLTGTQIFTRTLTPSTDDELASKWYVDQSQGYWSKTGSNVYTTDQVTVGWSASPTSTMTAFLFGVTSGRVGFMGGLTVFPDSVLNPVGVYSSYAFSVSGLSFFDGYSFTDRQFVNHPSLTAPISGTEYVTKDYVDTVSGSAIDGTPYYLPMIDSSSGNVIDSIVFQNGDPPEGSLDGLITVNGSMYVVEKLMAKEKNFNIPHPSYDDPEKRLIHASIETNRNEVEYSGKAKIVNYRCVVKLPEYYQQLVHKDSERVFMTPVGKWNDLYFMGVNYDKGILRFETAMTKEGSFYWMLKGERKDVDRLKVEIL